MRGLAEGVLHIEDYQKVATSHSLITLPLLLRMSRIDIKQGGLAFQ
jgi:hypothetical protein